MKKILCLIVGLLLTACAPVSIAATSVYQTDVPYTVAGTTYPYSESYSGSDFPSTPGPVIMFRQANGIERPYQWSDGYDWLYTVAIAKMYASPNLASVLVGSGDFILDQQKVLYLHEPCVDADNIKFIRVARIDSVRAWVDSASLATFDGSKVCP